MKKILLGIILGLFLYPALSDISWIMFMNGRKHAELTRKLWVTLAFPKYGFGDLFTGGCTKDIGENGHGWVFINRKYHQCSKLSIAISDLIYGEYTEPIDLELLNKLDSNLVDE